jgi:hypothetical protein
VYQQLVVNPLVSLGALNLPVQEQCLQAQKVDMGIGVRNIIKQKHHGQTQARSTPFIQYTHRHMHTTYIVSVEQMLAGVHAAWWPAQAVG